ncbi:hypothetical protein N0V85_008839, partial [Neurospora sp. IMI 360204]
MSTGWSFPHALNVFIADHRRHLGLYGINKLEDLRTDEDLIQGFQDTLLMPTVERLALLHDSALDNKYYTTTLLFVNEYLKYGPGYDMSIDINPGDDDAHWSVVIGQWIEGVTGSEFQKAKPGATPDSLIRSVSSVYAPGANPATDSFTMAQNIKRSMPDQTMQWVVQDTINSFKTYSQLLVNEWEIGRSEFNSTIHAAENQTQIGGGIGTLTFHGTDLVLMIHENQISGIFKGDVTNNYSSNTESGSGCFRPGTQVLTDGGPMNIEELREGTRVLTRGGEVPTARGAAFDHLDHDHRIFWLQGMAGTGKSTISRTVARMLDKSEALGASFFFKKGEGDRAKAARFFTTIASQLVHRLPALAQHMKEVIKTDPDIGEKFLKEQFEKLILQPLKRLDHDRRTSSKTVVIVIDALDECDSESNATAIIGLLPRTKELLSISLKFFVTSRPEFPILGEFRKINGTYQDLILHRVDERIVAGDISVYFDSELSKTRDDYNWSFPDGPLPSDWPGQSNLQILVKMAVPLFIFAKTVCLFVQDRKRGNPKTQLDKILRYQTMGQAFRLHAMYLPILNQMLMERPDSEFIRLTGEEQEAIVEEFREIVGALVILADPLSVKSLAGLLGIEEQAIGHRLSLLNSVLNIPSDVTAPVKTLHLSFRDFLVDPKMRATNPFWVDEEMTHGKLVTKCLKLLRDCLQEDICSLQRPGKSRADVDRQIFLKRLPSEIQYACLYWVYHLKRSRRTVRDGDEEHHFLIGYLLYWLEVLSLMGRISESIGLINDLQSVTD